MAGQLQSRRRGLVALSTVAGLLVVGWLAVIAAVAATWRQLDTDHRQLRRQLEVAGQDTQLQGADLSGAHLSGAHLSGARASTATTWPDGFDWRAAGARLVESC
jgi:hypothetical protein